MGSKLALLAAELIALVAIVGRDASADNASKAKDLFKQGIEQYKAKQYDAAAATLAKSYELDPRPDALFAEAQSERLGGHCAEAVKHYRKLLETSTDLPTIKIVQTSLAACPKEPDVVPTKIEPKPEAHHDVVQAPPQIITKTVVREVPRSDRLSTVLFAGGMLALGGGAGLYIASNGALEDAKHARTLDDHNKFSDRAKLERSLSYGVAGAGAVMITVAIIRWARGGPHEAAPPSAEVAVVPTSGGGLLSLSSVW